MVFLPIFTNLHLQAEDLQGISRGLLGDSRNVYLAQFSKNPRKLRHIGWHIATL
jgi:hypothetical protein